MSIATKSKAKAKAKASAKTTAETKSGKKSTQAAKAKGHSAQQSTRKRAAKEIRTRVFMHTLEAERHIKQLWEAESELMAVLWGRPADLTRSVLFPDAMPDAALPGSLGAGPQAFFVRVLPVPPPRFRPPRVLADLTSDHVQTSALVNVLSIAARLASDFASASQDGITAADRTKRTETAIASLIRMQETVNAYMDGSLSSERGAPSGIRQLLEKKAGLFRQNLMGKRVNFAARSVISPDVNIGADEVGVPVRFAKRLSYPEPVTPWNAAELAQMVCNGPDEHPGAVMVEEENGALIDLRKRNTRQRVEISQRILASAGVQQQQATMFSAGIRSGGSEQDQLNRDHEQRTAPLSLGRQKKVWRHLRSGDMLLANRQPTLHKSSIMAHKTFVIDNASMQTIRLHYANCNTYNADFDGDEINLHFPQSELARAEAEEIVYTDFQYCSPTNGAPLRGLIQDHIGLAVILTRRSTMLTRDEFVQMVFAACDGIKGKRVPIQVVPPAIMSGSRRAWTGKQVITAILSHLLRACDIEDPRGGLTMGPSKTKTPAKAWATVDEESAAEESLVIFRNGELCTGILDKAQLGASKFGLVHCVHGTFFAPPLLHHRHHHDHLLLLLLLLLLASFVPISLCKARHVRLDAGCCLLTHTQSHCLHPTRPHTELYGPHAAGELLSAMGRLFTHCAQKWGHTCAVEDLLLNHAAENERTEAISNAYKNTLGAAARYAGVGATETAEEVATALEEVVREQGSDESLLDSTMQGVTSKATSEIISACLPGGQRKAFPENCFSLMVMSGAKGSLVNHSQVSCALGQQALEGRRVPRMVSGKTLPCFSPFDPSARAGGFISDRFLTGIRPQEYYFHCMAGREGLVDTAVKTARSGYLQRCLVKHLEGLRIGYDRTVRGDDESVVQFMYGGDGLDPPSTMFLDPSSESVCKFVAENMPMMRKKLGHVPPGLDVKRAPAAAERVELSLRRTAENPFVPGSAVVVRKLRPRHSRDSTAEASFESTFSDATIVKQRLASDGTVRAVDVVFTADGSRAKKVPLRVLHAEQPESGQGPARYTPIVLPSVPDPIISTMQVDRHLGAVTERFQAALNKYVSENPHGLLDGDDAKASFVELMHLKFLRNLAAPGESVGPLAAQGIGEPSTQMTLNTFHLAGHGGANVTLGIPRLRELLMTASTKIKTPTMRVPLLPIATDKDVAEVRGKLDRVLLSSLLVAPRGIVVTETLCRTSSVYGKVATGADAQRAAASVVAGVDLQGTWSRVYEIELRLQPERAMEEEFGLSVRRVAKQVSRRFLTGLVSAIKAELRRANEKVVGGSGTAALSKRSASRKRRDGDDDDDGAEGGDLGAGGSDDERDASARRGGGKRDDDDDSAESGDDDTAGEEDGASRVGRKKELDYESSSEGEDDEEGDEDKAEAEDEGLDDGDGDGNGDGNGDGGKGYGTSTHILPDIPAEVFQCGFFRSAEYCTAGPNPTIRMSLSFAASQKRILMIGIAEDVAAAATVRSVRGVRNAFVDEEDDHAIVVEGCNLRHVWSLPRRVVDFARLQTNDIGAILEAYGVEAARAAIVREIQAVFGVYGIDISPRHLELVADYMTFGGGYRPLNRAGIEASTSPLLRMTFETSATFLTAAAAFGERDVMQSPSARIAFGQVVESGTGAFDVRMPVAAPVSE